MTLLQAAPVPPEPTGPAHERIAQARGFHRWSQEKLLAVMSTLDAENTPSRRTLSSWERGHTHPTVPELVLIAQATAFPVAWFVMGLESAPPTPTGGPISAERGSPCTRSPLAVVIPFRLHAA